MQRSVLSSDLDEESDLTDEGNKAQDSVHAKNQSL